MTERKRTASEIRAYCEAASEGEWRYSEDAWRVFSKLDGEDFELLAVQMFSADGRFAANARTDLPRVLEAAVKLRHIVVTEFESCVANRADIEMGCYQCSKWEGIDDGCEYDGVLRLLDETAFLADSPKAAGSTGGESGEESET